MSRNAGTRWWIAWALLPVLAVFAVCVVNSVRWIHQPFSGFLILENGIVVSIGRSEWVHARHRSIPFARVVGIDGQPVRRGGDVHAYAAAKGVGKPVTYTFRKGSGVFRLTVDVQDFGVRDFLELFVPLLSVGLLMIFASAAVVARRPQAPEARALFAVCTTIGLSLVTGPDAYYPYWFTEVFFLSLCCVPPAIVQLALAYPQRSELLQRGPLVYAVLYLPFLGFGVALIYSMPEPWLFLPLLYSVYLLTANAALLYVGRLVLALIEGLRPLEPILLALGAVLLSSLIAVLVLVTYPLLQRPISPVWFVAPLLLIPLLKGIAFLRFPAPRPPLAERAAA
jgi:hypothetical protein